MGGSGRPDWLFRGRSTKVAAWHSKKLGPTCCLCARAALRRVGTKGYCRAHLADAARHMKHLEYNKDYDARERQAQKREMYGE